MAGAVKDCMKEKKKKKKKISILRKFSRCYDSKGDSTFETPDHAKLFGRKER